MNFSTQKIVKTFLKESKNPNAKQNQCEELKQMLINRQHVLIYGASGSGKSSIVSGFANEKNFENSTIIRWINGSFFAHIVYELRKVVKELSDNYVEHNKWSNVSIGHENNKELEIENFDINANMNLDKIIEFIREQLNNKFSYLNFIFILDNVEIVDFIRKFTFGFNKNIKFVITSQSEELTYDYNFGKISSGFIISKNNAFNLDIKRFRLEFEIINYLILFDHDNISLLLLKQVLKHEGRKSEDIEKALNKLIEIGFLIEDYWGYSISACQKEDFVRKYENEIGNNKLFYKSKIFSALQELISNRDIDMKENFCYETALLLKTLNRKLSRLDKGEIQYWAKNYDKLQKKVKSLDEQTKKALFLVHNSNIFIN